jgi:hypothetical protein
MTYIRGVFHDPQPLLGLVGMGGRLGLVGICWGGELQYLTK